MVEEGEAVEDEEVEGDEAEDGEIEDSPPAADQFDLAKLLAGPIDFKIVSVIQHFEYSGWLPKTVCHVSFYL